MRVSVIIPVYNAEKYIEKCLNSIIPQLTLEDEIILINASSTDKTEEICSNYVKENNNIKLYNIENNGPSSSRNAGIKKATGKYIIFIDGDDYIEPDYISTMLKYVKERQLVICSYRMVQYETGTETIKKYSDKVEVLTKDDMIKVYEKELFSLVWNKIFERDIIIDNNIQFNTKFYKGEDLLFNLEYMKYIENVSVIPNVLYNYIIKKTGINKSYKEPIENRLQRTKLIYEGFMILNQNNNIDRVKINIVDMNFLHLRNYIKENNINNPFKIVKTLNKYTNLDYCLSDGNKYENLKNIKKLYDKKHITLMYLRNKLLLKKLRNE
mgnify:FL=1